ncbi:MAG: MBL fold metallo-hydrolase [Thermoplasmatota archaeon]
MINVRWHGHSCFELTDDVTLVTDPHDGSSIGIQPPGVRADVVLVSHDHYDHNKVKAVKKDDTTVVRDGETTVHDIQIAAYPGHHDREDGAKRGDISIFRFVMDGITFCHLGDLGHAIDDELAEQIGDIDVLFVPVGGVFTIGGEEALEVCNTINPSVVIPMHYKVGGLSLPIERIDTFLDAARPRYAIRHVANEIEVEKSDLPSEPEIWVFTL